MNDSSSTSSDDQSKPLSDGLRYRLGIRTPRGVPVEDVKPFLDEFIREGLFQGHTPDRLVKECLVENGGRLSEYVKGNGGADCVRASIDRARDGGGDRPPGGGGGDRSPGGDVPPPDDDKLFKITFARQPEIVGNKSKLPPTQINIVGSIAAQISSLVDKSVNALIEHDVPIFKRNHKLFAVLWELKCTDTQLSIWTKVPVLMPVDAGFLDYTLNKGVAIYKQEKQIVVGMNVNNESIKKKQLVDVGAPERLLKRITDIKHWSFKPIVGLINCPTMKPKGELLLTTGYDETGFYAYWDDSLKLPDIPERPTKQDAEEALKLLLGLLEEFEFVDDIDRAVAVAGLMTPVLRAAFDFAPLFFITAHAAGTGKSFLQDVVSAIANGRRCPVVDASKDTVELSKQIGALLLQGVSLIALDNLDHDLDSSLLNQTVSQFAVSPRILGKSQMPEIQWRGTIFGNGNNVQVTGDLVRRTLLINMNVPLERPETREFKGNPVREVLKDRSQYIAAVLTIARAYQVLEQKIKVVPLDGFDGWSKVVREPIIWLGLKDPVKSQDKSYREDPYRNASRDFLEFWKKAYGDKTHKAHEILAAALETVRPGTNPSFGGSDEWVNPGLNELLLEQCGDRGKISDTKFKRWMRDLHNRVFPLDDGNSYRLTVAAKSKGHGNSWKLELVTTAPGQPQS